MKRLALVAGPVALALVYLVAQFLVPDGARDRFFVVEVATMKILALTGCIVAASRYRLSEYVGIAWTLLGVHYGVLLANDLLFGPVVHLPGVVGHKADVLRAVCIIVANAAGGACAIMLARVWRAAGLIFPGSSAWQRAAVFLGMAVALAVVGWGMWRDLQSLVAGDPVAITAVASDLGDLVGFSMIAPLLLVAVAMRGGSLAWPWGLITASYIFWLLYDMTWSFHAQMSLREPTFLSLVELWRCLACGFAASAGLAQRWASRARTD
jgi:hypothetical protein